VNPIRDPRLITNRIFDASRLRYPIAERLAIANPFDRSLGPSDQAESGCGQRDEETITVTRAGGSELDDVGEMRPGSPTAAANEYETVINAPIRNHLGERGVPGQRERQIEERRNSRERERDRQRLVH